MIYHPDKNDPHPPSIISTPSLDGFLGFLEDHPQLLCCLELKEDNEELVKVVVDKITECGLEDRIYLTACQVRIPFLKLEASAKLLLKARARNPKIKTHLIATFPFCLPALVLKYDPNIISLGWLPESKLSAWFFKKFIMKFVDLKGQIKWVRSRGLKILGGVVNNDKDFEYLANLGVDGMMTDNSVAAMEFLKEKSP